MLRIRAEGRAITLAPNYKLVHGLLLKLLGTLIIYRVVAVKNALLSGRTTFVISYTHHALLAHALHV